MSCGFVNNPTIIQFKAAFQNLLCKTVNRQDNGNCIFDDISVLDLSDSNCELNFDVNFDSISDVAGDNMFVENILIYISGFIMRTLIKKEPCYICLTHLKECKNRTTCTLIKNKQRGGLMYPLTDIVTIVNLSNRKCETYSLLRLFN